MTTPQILDQFQRLPEGGLMVDTNRYDPLFLLSLLDAGRAAWVVEMYRKDKRIEPVFYQKYYPSYSIPLQPTDKCYAKFLMPDILRLDEHSDGIRYVGYDDYNGGTANNFRRIVSRAWVSTLSNHPVMNPNRAFSFLYDGSAKILELRGKAKLVEAPLVEALFKHPLDIPTFNRDTDDYPITMDGIYAVEKMITASDTRLVEATTPKPAFEQSQTPFPKK